MDTSMASIRLTFPGWHHQKNICTNKAVCSYMLLQQQSKTHCKYVNVYTLLTLWLISQSVSPNPLDD